MFYRFVTTRRCDCGYMHRCDYEAWRVGRSSSSSSRWVSGRPPLPRRWRSPPSRSSRSRATIRRSRAPPSLETWWCRPARPSARSFTVWGLPTTTRTIRCISRPPVRRRLRCDNIIGIGRYKNNIIIRPLLHLADTTAQILLVWLCCRPLIKSNMSQRMPGLASQAL